MGGTDWRQGVAGPRSTLELWSRVGGPAISCRPMLSLCAATLPPSLLPSASGFCHCTQPCRRRCGRRRCGRPRAAPGERPLTSAERCPSHQLSRSRAGVNGRSGGRVDAGRVLLRADGTGGRRAPGRGHAAGIQSKAVLIAGEARPPALDIDSVRLLPPATALLFCCGLPWTSRWPVPGEGPIHPQGFQHRPQKNSQLRNDLGERLRRRT